MIALVIMEGVKFQKMCYGKKSPLRTSVPNVANYIKNFSHHKVRTMSDHEVSAEHVLLEHIEEEDALAIILDEADVLPPEGVADELSFNQMHALAFGYMEWALDLNRTPQEAVRLIGKARGMRQLAELKGEEWNPPEPDKLSLVGFIARQFESRIG